MRYRRSVVLVLAIVLTGTAATGARAGRIGPGVLLPEPICTSNFVFRDATDLYLGTASHCMFLSDPGEFECADDTYGPGHPVIVEGATRPATLVYSSYYTMNRLGETDVFTCLYNDFALMRIDPADHASVDPSVPHFGGPVGLRREPLEPRETLLSYGRSTNRPDIEPLRPREGYLSGTGSEGWQHGAWFPNPAIFGDSGSAVIDGAGGAMGIVTRAGDVATAGTAGIGDLARALDYMRSHGGPDVRLVPGTAPFAGGTVPELVASPRSEPEPELTPEPEREPAAGAAPAPTAQPSAPPRSATRGKSKTKGKSCRRARTRKARRKCEQAKRRRAASRRAARH